MRIRSFEAEVTVDGEVRVARWDGAVLSFPVD